MFAEEPEETLDDLEIKPIEEEKKLIKKIEAELEELSDQEEEPEDILDDLEIKPIEEVEKLIKEIEAELEEISDQEEEPEDILDDLEIAEEKKLIKKIEAELEEMSDQFQNLEDESGLFKGKLSENFCPLLEQEFNLRISDIEKKKEDIKKRISELRREKIKLREKLFPGAWDKPFAGMTNLDSSFDFGVVTVVSQFSRPNRDHSAHFQDRDLPPKDQDEVLLIKTDLRQRLELSNKAFWKAEDPVFKNDQKEKYLDFLGHLVECSLINVNSRDLDGMVKVIYQTLELMTGGLNYQDAEQIFVSDEVPDAVEIVRKISVGQAKALIRDETDEDEENRDEGQKLQEEIEITAMVNSCLVETLKTRKVMKNKPNRKDTLDSLLIRETSEVIESIERLADRSGMENYNLARQKIERLAQLYFVFMGPCDKREFALTRTFFHDISVISLSVLGSILGLEVAYNPVLDGTAIDTSKSKVLKQTVFSVSRHLLHSILKRKQDLDDFLTEMLNLFMGEANNSNKTRDGKTERQRNETVGDRTVPPTDNSTSNEKFQSMRGKTNSRRGARGGGTPTGGRPQSYRRSPTRCHQPPPRGQHPGHIHYV